MLSSKSGADSGRKERRGPKRRIPWRKCICICQCWEKECWYYSKTSVWPWHSWEAKVIAWRAARHSWLLAIICSETDEQDPRIPKRFTQSWLLRWPIRTSGQRDTGNRDDCSIITGLPVFFSPYPPLSFLLVSILFTLSSLLSLSLPDSFSAYSDRTSSFPLPRPSSHPVCTSRFDILAFRLSSTPSSSFSLAKRSSSSSSGRQDMGPHSVHQRPCQILPHGWA